MAMSREHCHPDMTATLEQWRVFSAEVSKYIHNRTATAITSDDLLLLVFKLVRKETRSSMHTKRIYMRIACAAMREYMKVQQEAEDGKRHGA